MDSLLVPGGKLFPGGGAFELWSLPKILGTTGGGVLWCRSVEVAIELRKLRDGRNWGDLLWAMRLLGMRFTLAHDFWQGAEPSRGQPSRLQTGEVFAALDVWDKVVVDRREKLALAWPLAPKWLKRLNDRLPCVVPVSLNDDCNGERLAINIGISSGIRTFEHITPCGVSELIRVLPLPIHQDVTRSQLSELIKCLAAQVRFS